MKATAPYLVKVSVNIAFFKASLWLHKVSEGYVLPIYKTNFLGSIPEIVFPVKEMAFQEAMCS